MMRPAITATTSAQANLRILREYAGLNRNQVAAAIGTTASWLEKVEAGQRKASSIFIRRIADTIAESLVFPSLSNSRTVPNG